MFTFELSTVSFVSTGTHFQKWSVNCNSPVRFLAVENLQVMVVPFESNSLRVWFHSLNCEFTFESKYLSKVRPSWKRIYNRLNLKKMTFGVFPWWVHFSKSYSIMHFFFTFYREWAKQWTICHQITQQQLKIPSKLPCVHSWYWRSNESPWYQIHWSRSDWNGMTSRNHWRSNT